MKQQDAMKKEQICNQLSKIIIVTKVKTEWIKYRDSAEGRIHKLENRAEEITQNAAQRQTDEKFERKL